MPLMTLNYFSNALQKHSAATIVMPDPAIEPPYQVMFLLHGLSDDNTAWTRRSSIERYVDGLPLVVVMPDGGRGFYLDAKEGFAYGTAIGVELPSIVRRYFPVVNEWSITGLSMGGYGAIRLALVNPDTFVSAHSHSGAVEFGRTHRVEDAEFTRILGPDPMGGPSDLHHLVGTCPRLPSMRIDCGVDDFLIEHNRTFHAFLTQAGIAHEYEEFPGVHDWAYWDQHVPEAIAFHRKQMDF